jgi:transketolase
MSENIFDFKTMDLETLPKKATRTALGETLIALAKEGLPVVAVDADLSGSTTTKAFANATPENEKRLFNCGIAEQNMIGVASGLSLSGHIPFTGSFAVFATGRAYDQIRNSVAYSRLNVKITPTHAGISVGPDGGSHQMLEDIALMRGLPHMSVLVPADYASAAAALRLAANKKGPVYVRLGRAMVSQIYSPGCELQIGKAEVLKKGSDVTLVACGVEVQEALKAAQCLQTEGISAEVIDAFSIKPLDKQTILGSIAKTGCAVCAEEHSVYGGLFSAVSELLSEELPRTCKAVGIRDTFGKSGEFEELLAYFNLGARAIVEAVKKAISDKGIC